MSSIPDHTHGLNIMGLITARGGSKGIPRKNLVPIAGKPLIAHTIKAASESGVANRIIISTDDEEIAEVSRNWGGEVPFMRPSELSGDLDTSFPVVVHAIQWLDIHEGYKPDYVLLLQPTSPLRNASDIRKAVTIAFEKDADSVISVYEPKQHPSWMFELTDEDRFVDFDPEERELTRRQSLRPSYMLNGAIYLVKRNVILEQTHFYTDRTFALIMPAERSMDIDRIIDVQVAELLMQELGQKKHTS